MSDTNSQKTPQAAAGITTKQYYSRSERQFIQLGADGNHRKTGKCLVYLLAIIVALATIVLFFSSIVWRITSPRLKLSSLSLQNINSRSNYSSANNYDMTILAKLTIENDNFGRFHFDGSKAVVLYGNSTIGGGDIDGGSVGARGTVVMKVGTTWSENWNITSSSNTSGFVELISYAEMRGKVRVMKFVKKKLRVEMNCTMRLDLTNQSIRVFLCRS